MADNRARHGGGFIIASIFFSIVLMLIPLPDFLRFFRPEFVALTLIYWTMALPRHVGVGYAWLVGLSMDLVMGGALGLMAFSYAFIIYLVLTFHLQLRQYPIWQQAISIFSLVLLLQMLLLLTSPRVADWNFWLPPFVSMMLWPAIYTILRSVRRTFHVS